MSPSGTFYGDKKALGVGVVPHPQGPLAHSTLLPVGFECSLAISLRGEGVEVGAHLWTEGRVGVSAPGGSSRLSPHFVCPYFHLE